MQSGFPAPSPPPFGHPSMCSFMDQGGNSVAAHMWLSLTQIPNMEIGTGLASDIKSLLPLNHFSYFLSIMLMLWSFFPSFSHSPHPHL